jgi:hypothetical protein
VGVKNLDVCSHNGTEGRLPKPAWMASPLTSPVHWYFNSMMFAIKVIKIQVIALN